MPTFPALTQFIIPAACFSVYIITWVTSLRSTGNYLGSPAAAYQSFPAATAATVLLLRQRNFSVRPETFLGARVFCFLNKGQNSALSPQSDNVFPKIGCQPGKFRVLLISPLLALCGIFYSFLLSERIWGAFVLPVLV